MKLIRRKNKVSSHHSPSERKYILGDNTSFVVDEAYNTLRSNIIFSMPGKGCKVVEFTSCGMSDGKSINVLNTAITFAETNVKVLLIDCDLHAQVDVRVIPGISSASYLAARLARPWQDWRFASAHGVACDIVAEAERAGELFLATSGGEDPSRLSGELVQSGFGDARVTVAERLSYPDERITCATASEIAGQTFDDLNVMLIEPAGGAGSPAGSSATSEAPAGASAPAAASSAADSAGASRAASSRWPYASSGIPDELFIRGDVPMTKQEVRAVALAKLRLTATDTVWDVGAGTGSVSIEAALVARAGSVWAVERNAAGVRLIRENADAFGCGNVHAVPGVAPEALAKLPVPDAVFVGGSAGELPFIVEAALEKNSQVRLCVPCVTVETLTEACALLSGSRFKGFEACQVSAARAEAVGLHHLMKAQNPVFLVSARGAGGEGGAR